MLRHRSLPGVRLVGRAHLGAIYHARFEHEPTSTSENPDDLNGVLYLPAVPTLQEKLGMTVTMAQATVAIFLLSLGASQLVRGELMTAYGPRACVVLASATLVASAAAVPSVPRSSGS